MISGLGRYSTTVRCTAHVCFNWDNSGGTGSDPAQGGLYNFTLAGNRSDQQIGIATVDGNGLHLVGMKIVGFNGADACGWHAINQNSQTERTLLLDTWFHNNTKGIYLQGTQPHNSFMHNTWIALGCNLVSEGQTCIALGKYALLTGNFLTGVFNNDNRKGNTYAWSMDRGSGVARDTFISIGVDNNGQGPVIGVDFLDGNPPFQPWGTFLGYTTATRGEGNFASTLPGMRGSPYQIIDGGPGQPGGGAFRYGAFQTRRGTPGCKTEAKAGATCTTTVTWQPKFNDENYTAICTGAGIAHGTPVVAAFEKRHTTSVDVVTRATTGEASQFVAVDCVAYHDP
jgi:hypothetical protein